MTRESGRWVGVVGLAWIVAAACAPRKVPVEASASRLLDLGSGRCVAVNRLGQVLGVDDDGSTFLTDKSGSRTPLGVFEVGASAVGVALSANGTVVGYSEGSSGRHPIVYGSEGWKAVEGLGDAAGSAIHVDDAGEIVGVGSFADESAMHAFLIANGARRPLPLPNDKQSAAYLVGPPDRVAGIFETPEGETHAFVWSGGALRDLGTLGGTTSAPYGMNERGDVVGVAETADGSMHAFAAQHGAGLTDLGLPAGSSSSEARGIDDGGRIVGNLYEANGRSKAALFVPGDAPRELLSSEADLKLYSSVHVAAVAANGLVVGWALLSDPQGQPPVRCLLWGEGT